MYKDTESVVHMPSYKLYYLNGCIIVCTRRPRWNDDWVEWGKDCAISSLIRVITIHTLMGCYYMVCSGREKGSNNFKVHEGALHIIVKIYLNWNSPRTHPSEIYSLINKLPSSMSTSNNIVLTLHNLFSRQTQPLVNRSVVNLGCLEVIVCWFPPFLLNINVCTRFLVCYVEFLTLFLFRSPGTKSHKIQVCALASLTQVILITQQPYRSVWFLSRGESSKRIEAHKREENRVKAEKASSFRTHAYAKDTLWVWNKTTI